MTYGLALAGGGTRGAAHAGVLLALKEEKLLPDAIGGTSAGGIVAGCFAGGMEPEEICEEVHHLVKYGMVYLDPDIAGLMLLVPQLLFHRPISMQGFLKGRRLNRYYCELTKRQNLEEIAFPLLIPAVDLISGQTVCFTNYAKMGISPAKNILDKETRWSHKGELCNIMTASSSVPGVFSPVHMGGGCLVDGGVTNNLPVNLMIEAGASSVVAVDVGTDYKMPEDDNVFEILSHSFSIMRENLKECRSTGEILLLKPELTDKAGLLTFEYMEECMEEAYRYTKKNAGRIRRAICESEKNYDLTKRKRVL